MANETRSNEIAGLWHSQYFSNLLLMYAANLPAVSRLCYNEEVPNGNGNVLVIGGFAADTAAAVTEGDDFAATTTLDNAIGCTITCGTVGLIYEFTKLAQRGNRMGPTALMDWGAKLGAGFCLDLLETDLCTDFANASQSSGSTGVNATFANHMDLKYQLELALAHGRLVACYHPVQVQDIRTDLLTMTGQIFGDASMGVGMANRGVLDQYAGSLAGVDVFMSTHCPTANGAADRVGAMWIDSNPDGGSPEYAAFAYAVMWWPESTTQPNPLGISTWLAVDMCFGRHEATDTYYGKLVTDA